MTLTKGEAVEPQVGMMKDRSPKPNAPASIDEARFRQEAIGASLRRLFDEVVNEPVPDEFLSILRQADERTQNASVERRTAPDEAKE